MKAIRQERGSGGDGQACSRESNNSTKLKLKISIVEEERFPAILLVGRYVQDDPYRKHQVEAKCWNNNGNDALDAVDIAAMG